MTNKKESHVYEVARDLADEWAETAEQRIRDKVNEVLDGNLEQIVLIAAGFEKSSMYKGEYIWRVDHCNNRSGNSPIGNVIKDAIGNRFTEILGRVTLSDAETLKIKKEMRDLYLREYRNQLNQLVRNKAREHAHQYMKRTIDTALEGAAETVRLRLMEANK